MLIGGMWRPAASGRAEDVTSPCTSRWGVAMVITPFNYPALLVMPKLAKTVILPGRPWS